jgi:hypothetical protein
MTRVNNNETTSKPVRMRCTKRMVDIAKNEKRTRLGWLLLRGKNTNCQPWHKHRKQENERNFQQKKAKIQSGCWMRAMRMKRGSKTE